MTTVHYGVLVGIDSSPYNRHALDYAAAEAHRRHLPLTLLNAWQLYPVTAFGPPLMGVSLADGPFREAAADLLKTGADHVAELYPQLEVQSVVVEGATVNALVSASAHAQMLVIGRRHGPSIWLGSVLSSVPAAAHCPVVVVPSLAASEPGPVVVGVDGTRVSAEAVEFAFDQASRWGQPLLAVMAVDGSLGTPMPGAPDSSDLRSGADRDLAESLAGWSEKYPDVQVERVVELVNPLEALRRAAADARLVVVGSHGRGTLRRWALGSVSSSLLRAAPCTVVVVRPEYEDDEDTAGR